MNRYDLIWEKRYILAKNYYKHYGNLKIPFNFKTTDGINYDENGINLGQWIVNQKSLKKASKISQNRIDKLNELKMIWNSKRKENWDNMYMLAKKFFKTYNHLKIPLDFKTIDGINKDESGFELGSWLYNQILTYNNKKSYSLSNDRIDKLNALNIDWNFSLREEKWIQKYNLAKKYYELYGHLNISSKNKNNIKLRMWLNNQRIAYRNGSLLDERFKLLNEIGMVWNIKDNSYLDKEITKKNQKRISIKLYRILKEMLIDMKGNFNSIDDTYYINELFMEQLDKTMVKK